MTADFDVLLIHSCSVVKAAESTGNYGHPLPNWTTGITTTSGLSCRLQELSAQGRAELASASVQASHVLWMDYASAPSSLRASTAERTHRITNVLRRADSSSVHAGPFDVKHVANVGGEDHHLKLILQTVN